MECTILDTFGTVFCIRSENIELMHNIDYTVLSPHDPFEMMKKLFDT